MYRKVFGLTRYAFGENLAPGDLYPGSAQREADARVRHVLDLRGIGLVTGEVGSGKTTVCRKTTSELHPGMYRVFYVPLSTGNVMDMYKSIAWELGLPTERNRASAPAWIRYLQEEMRVSPFLASLHADPRWDSLLAAPRT